MRGRPTTEQPSVLMPLLQTGEGADHGPASVLLVDDEARILELFSDMLSELGHPVMTTSEPAAALDLIAERKFDIVFLDQYLGTVRGTELMQNMARKDPGLYFVIVTANGSADLAVESLQRGAADFITKPFFQDDVVRSIAFVNKKRELDRRQKGLLAELELRVRQKTDELINVHFSVLTALARAVEKKDLGTYGHSMRVGGYAERIAQRLILPPREQEDIRTAALLHDIGKIGISDCILGKPCRLTPEETDIVRRHPENGVEILKPLEHFRPILPAILHHHEHFDGSGYPGGLSGEQIPLLARIISVADTYDSIRSDRPYRAAQDHGFAAEVLTKKSGSQFDPQVVNIFLTLLAERASAAFVPPGLPRGETRPGIQPGRHV